MMTVAGRQAGDDEVDGHSPLTEIAREGAAACFSRPWRWRSPPNLAAHTTDRDAVRHALVVRNRALSEVSRETVMGDRIPGLPS
jgi:hypothetical protein